MARKKPTAESTDPCVTKDPSETTRQRLQELAPEAVDALRYIAKNAKSEKHRERAKWALRQHGYTEEAGSTGSEPKS